VDTGLFVIFTFSCHDIHIDVPLLLIQCIIIDFIVVSSCKLDLVAPNPDSPFNRL